MIINPYKVYEEKEETTYEIKKNIVKEISERIINENINLINSEDKKVINKKIEEILIGSYKLNDNDREKVKKQILDKIYGYDILQKFIIDNVTTDIRVVRYDQIYVKQLGIWKKVDEQFESKEELDNFIKFCALKNGANINFENPVVIFSDKSNKLRIEAGISPVSVNSSSLVIRIHRAEVEDTLEGLWIKVGMISKDEYVLLTKCINEKKNIILCGQGGSGKTTLLRALLNKLPKDIAITCNEETAELYLEDRNIIQRECILSRKEDKNIDLEKLAKHALVMSNDVIVIGEMKGKEANVFFDSISTGHMGLATVHADSSKNAIDRIITLIKKDIKAQYYTEKFLKEYISKCIDLILFMEGYKVKDILYMQCEKEEK